MKSKIGIISSTEAQDVSRKKGKEHLHAEKEGK